MKTEKIIFGNNTDEIWRQVTNDLNGDFLEYAVIIHQKDRKTLLDIDADPGVGFESGYQTTALRSRIVNAGGFKFVIYHQGVAA